MSEQDSPRFNRLGRAGRGTSDPVEAEVVPTEDVPAEAVEVPVESAPPPFKIFVKYIAGQGIELAYPLSNGMRSFTAGVTYELNDYGDFCRLNESRVDFVEVTETEPARL